MKLQEAIGKIEKECSIVRWIAEGMDVHQTFIEQFATHCLIATMWDDLPLERRLVILNNLIEQLNLNWRLMTPYLQETSREIPEDKD